MEGETPSIPVPFTSRLAQPIEAGQTLNLQGAFPADSKRSEINLLAKGNEIPNCNAILHMSIRFDDKKIVFNNLQEGSWGKEERVSIPYLKGDKFDFRIRAMEDHFEISADGKKIHEFKYREPYTAVEFFQIKGEVTLSAVHWGGRFYKIPWETGFPNGGLQAGQRVFMYGIPRGDRWNFDLLGRNGDILFHFNPRFKDKKVVRNSHRNGFWDIEEREGDFPFHQDQGFSLAVINEPFSIQIFINNERFGTFQHRCANPVGDYIGMRIDGDVEVTGIEFSH